MSFDLARWRDETRQRIADLAHDPQGVLARSGATTLYGFLLGSALLPVAAAYAHDPGSALVALSAVVGSVGANLVTNIVQHKYDGANALAVAAEEAQNSALAPAYEALAEQLQVVPMAETALAQAGQTAALEQLRDELRRLGKAGPFAGANINVQQSGGVNMGIGNTIGEIGDVFAGDKVSGGKHIYYSSPRPADTSPEHLRRLIEARTQRLRVLELEAARTGYSARPEVLNEIKDLRTEIAQLEAQLKDQGPKR